MNDQDVEVAARRTFEDLKVWADDRARFIESLTDEEKEARRLVQEREEQEILLAIKRAEMVRRLETIPLRLRTLPFEFPPEVASWVDELTKGDVRSLPSLLIAGPNGVGKTAVACMILRAAIEAELPDPIMFMPVRTLLNRLRPGGDASWGLVDQLAKSTLLCLDDLRAFKQSEWAEEQLLEIVDYRYMWQRPMVITLDDLPEEMENFLGYRTASRLNEICRVVAMDGPDRRAG